MRMPGTAKETADFPPIAQVRTNMSLAISAQSCQGRTAALRPKIVRYLCYTMEQPSSFWGSEPRRDSSMTLMHLIARLACPLPETFPPEAAHYCLIPSSTRCQHMPNLEEEAIPACTSTWPSPLT